MNKGTNFTDAQAMSVVHNNFEAPTLQDLAEIKVGNTVKVCANNPHTSSERFWAEITSVDGENIEARVDNDLVHADELGFGFDDTIKFEKKHIYSIFE